MTDKVGHRVLREYAKLADAYERKWSHYVRATAEQTLARTVFDPGMSVLDVGCGTGELLHRLKRSHRGGLLAGVDPSGEMLALARRRLPPEVILLRAWAERIPFPDRQFDLVISCNMFHYIADPQVAVAEMRRVLKPGGSLVITDWCDDYLACWLCGLLLRVFRRPFHRLYGSKSCRSLLQQSGLQDLSIERYKINWLWGLMTAKGTH